MTGTLSAIAEPVTPSRRGESFLFVVLECDRPEAGGARISLSDVDVVEIGRDETRSSTRSERDGSVRIALELPDARVSTQHARLVRLAGRWVLEDLGSKNGTLVNGDPIKRVELGEDDVIEIGHTFVSVRRLLLSTARPDLDTERVTRASPIFNTLSPELEARLEALAQIARAEVPLIIRGETGTGKELAARAVHDRSERRGRFVAVSCAALPPNLVESELFGFRRGAFSGATEDRSGLVRAADRGTLFLDEIGELPPAAQGALLRVLQEREVLAIGATEPVKVDVRVVAATHRDLAAMVEKGSFRADLLARLRGYVFELPPLRERREDVGILVAAFLSDRRIRLTPAALRALLGYDFPENVRELEQSIRTASALAQNGMIELSHLPEPMRSAPDAKAIAVPLESLSDADRELLERLRQELTAHRGNLSAVARALGKDRTQIRRWLTRFGIDAESFR